MAWPRTTESTQIPLWKLYVALGKFELVNAGVGSNRANAAWKNITSSIEILALIGQMDPKSRFLNRIQKKRI